MNGVVEQYFLPAPQVWQCPIAVNTFHAGNAVSGDFFEEAFDDDSGRGEVAAWAEQLFASKHATKHCALGRISNLSASL